MADIIVLPLKINIKIKLSAVYWKKDINQTLETDLGSRDHHF